MASSLHTVGKQLSGCCACFPLVDVGSRLSIEDLATLIADVEILVSLEWIGCGNVAEGWI